MNPRATIAEVNVNTTDTPAFLKPELSWAEIKQLTCLRNIVEIVADEFGASEENVLAAMYHTLGVAAGNSMKIQVGGRLRLCPGFNLVSTDESKTPLNYMRAISGTFTEELQREIRTFDDEIRNGGNIRAQAKRIAEREKEAKEHRRVNVPGALARYYSKGRSPIGNCLVVNSLRLKTLEHAISDSPDFHVYIDNPPLAGIVDLEKWRPGALSILWALLNGGHDAQARCPVEGYTAGGARLRAELNPKEVLLFLALPGLGDSDTLFLPAEKNPVKNLLGSAPEPLLSFQKIVEMLFADRLARGKQAQVVTLTHGFPYKTFLEQAFEWERSKANRFGLRVVWLAELALKFALLHLLLPCDGERETKRSLRFGIEFAKRLGKKHLNVLHRVLAGEDKTDQFATAGLTDREIWIFTRICQRGPLSLKELGRSFNRLPTEERNRVVAKLLERNLIAFDGECVQQRIVNGDREDEGSVRDNFAEKHADDGQLY